MDNFTRGYLTCALFATTGDDGNPLDVKYHLSDLSPATIDIANGVCQDFQEANAADLALYYQMREEKEGIRSAPGDDTWEDYAGHDFWLTRNGHGAGFWDRGLGEVGDRLTAAAKVYSATDLYVGDDGKLYLS